MKAPENILITGASSGLGAEFARQYATAGVTLFLTARNNQRLELVAGECRAKGAKVETQAMDIRDYKRVAEWVITCDQNAAIDLVIANAGISGGSAGGGETTEQVRSIFAVNVEGVINTIQPLIPRLKERHSGHIAIISSLAAYRGIPSAPAYSASKAAVKVYGEALRGILHAHGVNVTVVTPGYIKTPMTAANNFPMPWLMEADEAVRLIKKKLARNPARIAFPLPLYLAVWTLACLPPWLTDPILRKMPKKHRTGAAN